MPTNSTNHLSRRAGILATIILAFALFGASGAVSQAKASPVSLTFDNGRLTVGSIFHDRVVLPATDSFPSDDLPLPQRTDIQLLGDLNGDQVSFPSALNTGLQFPYMHLMHPIEQDLMIPVTMRLNDPGLTGTWDAASGAMTLSGKVDLIVVTGTGANFPVPDTLIDLADPPLSLFARCRIDDVQMDFSTATESPTTGEPFTGGFGKHGALTASWSDLPDAKAENGGDCALLNTMVHSPGGLWLSNGIAEPIPQKEPEATCENTPSLCPPPEYALVDDVRLRPARKTVRRKGRAVLTVRVHNSGSAAATGVKVRVRSSNRRVRAPAAVTLNVPAGRAATRRFVVRVGAAAKGRAVIRAATNGWAGRAVLKVKKPKRKHRHHR